MNADLIAKLRADTPGCSSLLHFNNAGCALTPAPVLGAIGGHLALEQRLGGYEAAEQQTAAIQNFYAAMGRLLNCQSGEIAWMESATRAWATAITSIGLRPGDKVITGQSEYASNLLAMLQLQRMLGIEICVIPNDSRGAVDLDRMEAAIDKTVRLIALTHVPSQFGVTQPAAEAGRIAAAHGLLFLLDVCQSAGQMALDVELLGCHMLTGSGRKFLRGPRGSGFLYVSKSVIDRLQPLTADLGAAEWLSEDQYRLHDDARRFESWECFVAGKIALGVAADYAGSLGLECIASRMGLLTQKLDQGLRELPGIVVHEPPGSHPGIITFSSRHESADELRARLRTASVNISVARLASNRLDFKTRNLPDLCRISPHYYNTEAEIEYFLGLLRDRIGRQGRPYAPAGRGKTPSSSR